MEEDFTSYDLLLDYKQYPPSESCYLDGRYFNIVFGDYPGLIEYPLYIHLGKENKIETYLPHLKIQPSNDYFGLLRVIVTSDKIRHSMIVILDYEKQEAFIYNPDTYHSNLNDMLIENITNFLSQFFNYEYFEIPRIEYNEKEEIKLKCKKYGTCNALVILYALCFIEGIEFNNRSVQDIRKFMTAIETNFDLPKGKPDKEYLTDSQLIGTVAGVGIGGIVGSTAGPGGLIAGAALGGLSGYALGSLADSNRYNNRYY